MNYTARQLNINETLEAKHFLYDIYANQLGWLPDGQNPSQWVVKEDSDGEYFEDLFNGNAQWFGVFTSGTIVASGRLLRPVDNKLELELYTDIPAQFGSGNASRVEMNRIAVDAAHNGTKALSMLFTTMLQYAKQTGIDYIFTGSPESALPIIREMNFTVLHTFSYAADGSDTVYSAFFDVNSLEVFNDTLRSLEQKRLTLRFS